MATSRHAISIEMAKKLTSEYRKNKTKILKDEYHTKATLPLCETFDRDAFDNLLAKNDCTGVRFYFGMDEEMNVKLVFVGVNEKNEDMVPQQLTDTTDLTKENLESNLNLYNSGTRCPTECPPDSTLNQD